MNKEIESPIKKDTGFARILTILFVVFLLILISLLTWSYFTLGKDVITSNLDESITKKNEDVAILSSQIIKKQLEQIQILGLHYASKPEIIALMKEGQWNEISPLLLPILKEVGGAIEIIELADINGTIKTSFPLNNEVIGSNFAFSDWYRGVTNDWQSYLSSVYVRSSEPKYNVVGFAFPIINSTQNPIGILLFEVSLDIFQDWIAGINIGNTGKTFVVDQYGQLVVHHDIITQTEITDYSAQSTEITDYSAQSDVKQVLLGKMGSDIVLDDNQFISSFVPIPEFGWGVINRISLEEAKNTPDNFWTQNNKNYILFIIVILTIVIGLVSWSFIRRANS